MNVLHVHTEEERCSGFSHLLTKKIPGFSRPQNIFPGRCRSTVTFKCKDKWQLLTQNIQWGTTIHKSRGQRPRGSWEGATPPPARLCGVLLSSQGVWGRAPEASQTFSFNFDCYGWPLV